MCPSLREELMSDSENRNLQWAGLDTSLWGLSNNFSESVTRVSKGIVFAGSLVVTSEPMSGTLRSAALNALPSLSLWPFGHLYGRVSIHAATARLEYPGKEELGNRSNSLCIWYGVPGSPRRPYPAPEDALPRASFVYHVPESSAASCWRLPESRP
jgi:hypothetical protein